MSLHEELNRHKKATKLAPLVLHLSRDEIVRLHSDEWVKLAKEAGVFSPSWLTIELVADLVAKHREASERAFARFDDDEREFSR